MTEQQIAGFFKKTWPDQQTRSLIVKFIKLCLCGTTHANIGVYHMIAMLEDEAIERIKYGSKKYINLYITNI